MVDQGGNPNLPQQKPLEETGTRDDDPLANAKRRRTRIKRLYGQGEVTDSNGNKQSNDKFWIDIEVIDNATNAGAQFPGVEGGNQPLDTIQILDNSRGLHVREKEELNIAMDPSDVKKGPYVTIFAVKSMLFDLKGGTQLKREFDNSQQNQTRISIGRRIACNIIDDDFLHGPDDDRQPPSDPVKYMDAVYETDDMQSLWLDVNIPKLFYMRRGLTTKFQELNFHYLWKVDQIIHLPGMELKSPNKQPLYVTMDPFQAIINFGPDSLAVKFYKGEGPTK